MEIIVIIIEKIKFFLAGFLGGAVIHHFENKGKNQKMIWSQFVMASTVFGLLTVFGQWVVSGWLEETREEKILVLSLLTAVLVQFIIPFILRNPEKFLIYIAKRFGIQVENIIEKTKEKDGKNEMK